MLPSLALALAFSTTDAATVDAVFARWDATAREMKSLHVEFEMTESEPVVKRETKSSCTLRLLRTDGGVIGDGTIRQGDRTYRLMLRDDTVYMTDPDKKVALRFELEVWFPLAVLLDRPRVEKAYSVTVANRDEWYTHLSLTPKDVKAGLSSGLVVVPHRKNDTLPVGMPRLVVSNKTDHLAYRWDITKWVMNGDTPPKASEFELPTEKDGWTITEWPPKLKLTK